MKRMPKLTALAGFVSLPLFVHAHPGHDGHDLTWSFSSFFAHPLSGWGYVFVVLAVGLFAALLPGRERWVKWVGFKNAPKACADRSQAAVTNQP